MPFPIVPGDSDRVGNSVGAMGLELELAYRSLLSTDKQLVFYYIPVLGFGNLSGRDEAEQFLSDHHSLPAMLFPFGRTSGEPLAEAGMFLHLAVSTVTQYLGWDIIQKRG